MAGALYMACGLTSVTKSGSTVAPEQGRPGRGSGVCCRVTVEAGQRAYSRQAAGQLRGGAPRSQAGIGRRGLVQELTRLPWARDEVAPASEGQLLKGN